MKIDDGSAFRLQVIGVACLYVGLAAVVFFLAFCNLDGRLFWGDEAETGLLAKNILKFGLPKVDDGVNHISLHGDKFDAHNGVWTWSPWLPDYVAASSFAIFGTTTWAGRAPFAFIGWLSVMLLGGMAWKIYRSHAVVLSSMLLLGTSEVFLLHIRQCHYYSITLLAEILLVYGLYHILKNNRVGAWFILGGLILEFYCNYAIAVANVPLLLVLAIQLFRQKRNSVWPLMLALGIWLLLSVPWLLYAGAWHQGSAEKHDAWTHMLRFYLWQFNFHFLPLCIFLLPLWGWFSSRRSQGAPETSPGTERRFEKYLLLLPFLYVPVLLAMPLPFSRYLLPVLPVMCLLVAVWIFRYIQWRVLSVGLIIILSASNLFSMVSGLPFGYGGVLRFPPLEYALGVTEPYADRFADALDFFKKQAQPGQHVLSFDPEFPLIFYTEIGVIDGRIAPPPSDVLPDWILPVSVSGDLTREPVVLPDSLKSHYTLITIPVHDSGMLDSVPEPDLYQYRMPATSVPFLIYQLNARSPSVDSGKADRDHR
jgi:hypothetical protein